MVSDRCFCGTLAICRAGLGKISGFVALQFRRLIPTAEMWLRTALAARPDDRWMAIADAGINQLRRHSGLISIWQRLGEGSRSRQAWKQRQGCGVPLRRLHGLSKTSKAPMRWRFRIPRTG